MDPAKALMLLHTWLSKMADHLNDPDGRGCRFANAAVELPDKSHPARRVIKPYKIAHRRWLRRANWLSAHRDVNRKARTPYRGGTWEPESAIIGAEAAMKIDQDYLKKLLEICEAAPTPIFDIEELKAAGVDYDTDQFIFHMSILNDLGVVERDDGEQGFGLVRGIDGFKSWAVLPLRLTAQGHQFIEALRNKEVWATIKRDFKDASVNTLWDVSKKLLEGYTRKKIEALLNGEVPI
jgi:hypothetical protein